MNQQQALDRLLNPGPTAAQVEAKRAKVFATRGQPDTPLTSAQVDAEQWKEPCRKPTGT